MWSLTQRLMSSWLEPEIRTLLLQGIWLTVVLTLLTTVLSVVIGVLMGTLRLSGSRWLAWPATAFVETFRNIPALILIIFWAFAFPNAFPTEVRSGLFFNNLFMNEIGRLTGLLLPWYALAATLGLTLNTAAYVAELFRAGVGTIAREHIDAAKTMGIPNLTIFRSIILPGGLRAAYPAITSRLIHNMKNTALASFVSVPEFFAGIQGAINKSFQAIEFLSLAAIVYLILSFLLSLLLRQLERLLYPRNKEAIPQIEARIG